MNVFGLGHSQATRRQGSSNEWKRLERESETRQRGERSLWMETAVRVPCSEWGTDLLWKP